MYVMTAEDIARRDVLKRVKASLKETAAIIKATKGLRKPYALKMSGDERPSWRIESDISRHRNDFRVEHIAYCEFRGRTRNQIERPRPNGWLCEGCINRLKKAWQTEIDAATVPDANE